MSSLPSATAEIRWMRPRGDDGSRSVSTYVGQVGRHSPQRMQRCRISSLGWSLPVKPCTADLVAIPSDVNADATACCSACCCTSLLTLALAFSVRALSCERITFLSHGSWRRCSIATLLYQRCSQHNPLLI